MGSDGAVGVGKSRRYGIGIGVKSGKNGKQFWIGTPAYLLSPLLAALQCDRRLLMGRAATPVMHTDPLGCTGSCWGSSGNADRLSDLGLPTCLKPQETWRVAASKPPNLVERVALLVARASLGLLLLALEPIGWLIMHLKPS